MFFGHHQKRWRDSAYVSNYTFNARRTDRCLGWSSSESSIRTGRLGIYLSNYRTWIIQVGLQSPRTVEILCYLGSLAPRQRSWSLCCAAHRLVPFYENDHEVPCRSRRLYGVVSVPSKSICCTYAVSTGSALGGTPSLCCRIISNSAGYYTDWLFVVQYMISCTFWKLGYILVTMSTAISIITLIWMITIWFTDNSQFWLRSLLRAVCCLSGCGYRILLGLIDPNRVSGL